MLLNRFLFPILAVLLFSFTALAGNHQLVPVSADSKEPPKIVREKPPGTARLTAFYPPQELNSICFDSSRNGYCWNGNRPIDYSRKQDVLGVAYRMFVPGLPIPDWGGWTRYWLNDPFIPASLVTGDLAYGITYPLSVRYPVLLATDTCAVILVINYEPGTGNNILFVVVNPWDDYSPIHSLIPIPLPWSELFDFSADIDKINSGDYRIGLIGKNGLLFIDSPDGVQWNLVHHIAFADSLSLLINNPHLAWGNNGFGAWMSGNLFETTFDYGYSWSGLQTVNIAGIPDSIFAADSIFVPDPGSPADSVLYVGPAYWCTSADIGFLIQPDNKMHLATTLLWGPYTDSTHTNFYPHAKWTGLYDFSSSDLGLSWNPARIWINSGLNPGDVPGNFVFSNEIGLGQDEQGTIYAAWVDRDPVNPVLSPYPRRSSMITDYNVDIWASRSVDGGQTWSLTPVRVTNNQQVSHYGFPKNATS